MEIVQKAVIILNMSSMFIFIHECVLVGFGKNKACEISTGMYLCFQDVVSNSNRISLHSFKKI